MNNQIILNINDGKVKLRMRKPLNIAEFLTVMSTGILSALQGTVQNAPEELKKQVTEDLYDMYNAAASNLLQYFAPEMELRPDLTAQAILEAENKIITEQYKEAKKCNGTSQNAQDVTPRQSKVNPSQVLRPNFGKNV